MVTLEEGILRLRKQKSPFKNIDHIEELCQKKFTLSPYKIIHKGILPNKKCCIGKKRKKSFCSVTTQSCGSGSRFF